MSNQVGLILSFFFLTIFILFSSELIAYQQISAKALANTSNLALYVQKNGIDDNEENYLKYNDYFNEIIVDKQQDLQNGLTFYSIKTIKTYNSFTNLFSYNSKDIVCVMVICRKE